MLRWTRCAQKLCHSTSSAMLPCLCRRSSLDMRSKASEASDAANKVLLNVDEKYFNKCRRMASSCCCCCLYLCLLSLLTLYDILYDDPSINTIYQLCLYHSFIHLFESGNQARRKTKQEHKNMHEIQTDRQTHKNHVTQKTLQA